MILILIYIFNLSYKIIYYDYWRQASNTIIELSSEHSAIYLISLFGF